MHGRDKTLRVHAWCKRLTFLRLLGFRCVLAILPRGSFLIRSGASSFCNITQPFSLSVVGGWLTLSPEGGRSDSPSLTHTRSVCSEAPGHKVLVVAVVSVVL